VSDLMSDLVHVGDLFGEEDRAASGLGKSLQRALRPLGFATFLVAEEADAVNEHFTLLGGFY
jgi:hypothetical protein